MEVSILGTKYYIKICKRSEDKKLKNNPDVSGYCDFSSKKIVIVNELEESVLDTDALDNLDVVIKNVLRHELTHAFCYESALDTSSPMRDELVIDWIALQLPKIWEAYSSLEKNVDTIINNSTNKKIKKRKVE